MFTNNDQFFPTPQELVFKMLDKINKKNYALASIRYILEPSAGKGNIIDAYEKYYIRHGRVFLKEGESPRKYLKFDVIENDENLVQLLRGRKENVVWNDFLTFEPQRFYDLIILNPPFINGSDHAIRAIEIQERIGGKVLCILNAETLKNPYSNSRKHLLQLIQNYNGEVEYIENAFSEAERQTDVEIALIYIDVPMKNNETMFEKEFKRDNPDIQVENIQSLMPQMTKLQALVFEYDMIKKSTIELFREQARINNLLEGFGLKSLVTICDDKSKPDLLTVNDFINSINLKYWLKFINETNLKSRLPSKLKDYFTYEMDRQQDIAFTMENVQYFYEELINSIPRSYEETVALIFDALTRKYCYTDSTWNTNIHYYNGWKTNSCYKINKKSIIKGYVKYDDLPTELLDLNIIFENITGIKDDINKDKDIVEGIKYYRKNVETKHFILNSFKKGTIHIEYKDKQALEIFNILASKGKNWLPPDFMTKKAEDMTEEDRQLIKNFGLTTQEYNALALVGNGNNYLRLN